VISCERLECNGKRRQAMQGSSAMFVTVGSTPQ
jgi:hypothetical protein